MRKHLNYVQYLGFFSIGIVSNIIGPLLPTIRARITMSYGQSGLLLAGMCPGMLLMITIGGYLSDKFGNKLLLNIGSTALCLGLLLSMMAGNYWVLLACLVISGVGFGAYVIGINVLCSVSNESKKGRAMNFLHFFFGFGSIIGPVLVTVCLRLFNNWRLVFGILAILPFMVILISRRVVIQKPQFCSEIEGILPFKSIAIWICGTFIFVYVGIEASFQGWIAAFWDKVSYQSIFPAPLTASFFWISLTLGRLILGMLMDLKHLQRFQTLASFACMILILIWICSPVAWWTLLVIFLLGILMAGIYPTQLGLTTSLYPETTGMITAFISGAGSLGAFIIPPVIGAMSDKVGIIRFSLFIFGLTGFMLSLAVFQERLIKNGFHKKLIANSIKDNKNIPSGLSLNSKP